MAPKVDPETGKTAEIEGSGGEGPVDPRAEMVVVLAQQSFGRNEISRRTGIPAVTVSAIAKANGIKFDRSKTEQALKARITDLQVAAAGIAEGLHEDITFARMLLRTARTHRDYAFAAKAVADLTRSAQAMTPEVSASEELAETRDFLTGLRTELAEARDRHVQEQKENSSERE